MEFSEEQGWIASGNFPGTPYWQSKDQRWAQFVALDMAHNQAIVGSVASKDNSGMVAFFTRAPNKQWIAPTFVIPNPLAPSNDTNFGASLAIRGDLAFVGAPQQSFGTNFTFSAPVLVLTFLLDGLPYAGAVNIYQRRINTWTFVESFNSRSCATRQCSGMMFGSSLGFTATNNILAIGSADGCEFWEITSTPTTASVKYSFQILTPSVRAVQQFSFSADGSQYMVTNTAPEMAMYCTPCD